MYAPGILGRNCAVDRLMLAQSEALGAPAHTGTDYVLAKMLVRQGNRIRQVPDSRIATEYPTSARDYVRQQRRWMRNVVLHGATYQATNEILLVLRTALTGILMLILPLVGLLFMPIIVLGWFVLMTHAIISRLRYLVITCAILDRSFSLHIIGWQVPMLILDFIAWSSLFLDFVPHSKRWSW
jgi:cellulose synthase/poly-beta-1,6-N-acetylglucosamine synthase-like glycosyltransferase